MTFQTNIFLALAIGHATGQIWTPQNHTSFYECKAVRNPFNKTNVTTHPLPARSLASCAHHCTMATRVKPVGFYYDMEANQCFCGSQLDTNDEDLRQAEIKYCTLGSSVRVDKAANHHTRLELWPYKRDCFSIFYDLIDNYLPRQEKQVIKWWNTLHAKVGVHVVYPHDNTPVDVWCDDDRTVIQRRLDGREHFNRNWTDYVDGFGDTTGEYWIGLKHLHRFANTDFRLLFDVKSSESERSLFQLHYMISVGNEGSNYVLNYYSLPHYFSNNIALGTLSHCQQNVQFSTIDRDNDDFERNLAVVTQSGWWLSNTSISQANPNSPYAYLSCEDEEQPGDLQAFFNCSNICDGHFKPVIELSLHPK